METYLLYLYHASPVKAELHVGYLSNSFESALTCKAASDLLTSNSRNKLSNVFKIEGKIVLKT